ncbi:leucyl/phenylalanyl-tRNA--protein transferase [Microbulbifer sediminum]|uniref:leucyl/phenylalanyl-tRNA--protein transferase n=1 Tax=Microbulbifer sediminum TaxID=2904250 RepID=UPI001F01539F|nr:leucyl/phenylalanyl-tRNA--protein transferase [Microbulbifer sediminum]
MTRQSEERLSLLGEGPPDFPPTHQALGDPNGLLAVGGQLTPEWLLAAYKRGIFPWYSDGQPILWWSPSPRCVVLPDRFSIGRSLRKTLRRGRYTVTFDRCFGEVIQACSEPRAQDDGTWITGEMREAYLEMHRLGYAHSVETWEGDRLVGGLYGLAIGRVFFGESMFHRETDASKVAFAHLVRQLQFWGCPLIDCQVSNPHLTSLGAVEVERAAFEQLLARGTAMSDFPRPWTLSRNIAL